MGKRVFKIGICAIVYLMLSLTVNAQYNRLENANWAFGRKLGLKFDTISGSMPDFFNSSIYQSGNSQIMYYEAAATVSDSLGNLLFYTNGSRVWNRNHKVMPNSVQGLHGFGPYDEMTTSTTTGAVIVPVPFTPNKYYIFSLTGISAMMEENAGSLYYSVIDMTLDGGLGDVVDTQQWLFVKDKLSEKMTPIKGNCGNIWLVLHARDTNLFLSYEITQKGINPTPVRSYTGYVGNYTYQFLSGRKGNFYFSIGEMKASPNSQKIGMVNQVTGKFAALYDFDPNTGMVSNEIIIDDSTAEIYSCDFSPDSRKFYYSVNGSSFFGYPDPNRGIFQFNLDSVTQKGIKKSRKQILSVGMRPQMRLAPNGYIHTFMGYVENPNSSNPVFKLYPFPLSDSLDGKVPDSARGFFGLGQPILFAEYPENSKSGVHYDTLTCMDTTVFLSPTLSGSKYIWDDGSQLSSRRVTDTGTFWVKSLLNCMWNIDTFRIYLNDDFNFDFKLPDDTVLCNYDVWEIKGPKHAKDVQYRWQDGSNVENYFAEKTGKYHLNIRKGFCETNDSMHIKFIRTNPKLGDDLVFCLEDIIDTLLTIHIETSNNPTILWNTGSAQRFIRITEPGAYYVTVTDSTCIGSDTVIVSKVLCDCDLNYPNAFTPNNDGLNDYFLPFDISCPLEFYQFSIFDRFGNRVFDTDNINEGWDGNYKGKPLELGVYFFYAKYKSSGIQGKTKYKKGDVTLIH